MDHFGLGDDIYGARGVPHLNLPIDETFDIELANKLSRLETFNKHLYRPNTYLHKWWARRCGSTFRMLLKHLVEDPVKADYYSAGGLEGKIVLDPMAGGGTILHEALRMGANVVGIDVDPIPILQAQVTLSVVSLPELETAFADFHRRLSTELSDYYQTTCPMCSRLAQIRYVLHGVRRMCDCGESIFVDSLIIRQEADDSTIKLCSRCHAVIHGKEECECPIDCAKPILREKGLTHCGVCHQSFVELIDIAFYSRYSPLVIVARCREHGLFHKAVRRQDQLLIEYTNRAGHELDFGSGFDIQPGLKSMDLIKRGISSYLELFSGRQLLFLQSALTLIREMEDPIRPYLALLLSTSLEFNSMLSGYKGAGRRRAGAVRHAFSHHAYSFPYTALENNPIYSRQASGTLNKLFNDRVRRARLWALQPRERLMTGDDARFQLIRGEIDMGEQVTRPADLLNGLRRFYLRQGTSTKLELSDDSVDFVITDPPYFDNVQYSDLSAFFRVWLDKSLPRNDYPGIQWDYDLQASAVEGQTIKNNKSIEERYLQVMSGIFAECHRVLRKGSGRMIFTFHHWQAAGWFALTLALKRSGFNLVARYVVHSENPISVHISNLRALTDDAVLILAPVEAGLGRIWQKPQTINTDDSAAFCNQCAGLLGWVLENDIPDDRQKAIWQSALGN